MNRWAARRPFSVWGGLLLTVAMWAAAGWAAVQLADQLAGAPRDWPLTLRSFGLLVAVLIGLSLGAILFYRALSALLMRYQVDRNAVTVHWLGNRAVIPMDRIAAVTVGAPPMRLPWFGARLLGYNRGSGTTADGATVHLFAPGPLKEAVAVTLANGSIYVIAPAQRDSFVQEVEGRRGLGVVQGQAEGVVRTTRVSYPFWTDGLVRLMLMLGLLLNLALWGILSTRYSQIAALVSLRFDATGAAIGVVSREQLLALPLIGLLVWLANTAISLAVYRSSRVGALLLLIGSSVIQGLLAVALGYVMLHS